MSIDNSIEHMLINTRSCGKTTALVKAAKENNGVIVCHSHQEADRLRKQYEVEAVSIDHDHYWQGRRPAPMPFVEPDALRTLLEAHARNTVGLREMVQKRGAENLSLRNKLFDANNTLQEQRRINRLMAGQMKGALAVCWLINSMGQFSHPWNGESE